MMRSPKDLRSSRSLDPPRRFSRTGGVRRLDGDEQIQRAIGAPIRDLDRQCFLPPAEGRAIWHSPVQVRHLQQAGHHPASPWSLGPVAFSWLDLPQRQLEQDLDRQVKLDRRIREHRRPTGAANMRRKPSLLLVQPDQQ